MRFETRELKEHSEPVAVERLREGTTYFSLSFLDKEMLVPTLEPVVFVGCNLEPDDEERLFYFQDADSYRAGFAITRTSRTPAVPMRRSSLVASPVSSSCMGPRLMCCSFS